MLLFPALLTLGVVLFLLYRWLSPHVAQMNGEEVSPPPPLPLSSSLNRLAIQGAERLSTLFFHQTSIHRLSQRVSPAPFSLYEEEDACDPEEEEDTLLPDPTPLPTDPSPSPSPNPEEEEIPPPSTRDVQRSLRDLSLATDPGPFLHEVRIHLTTLYTLAPSTHTLVRRQIVCPHGWRQATWDLLIGSPDEGSQKGVGVLRQAGIVVYDPDDCTTRLLPDTDEEAMTSFSTWWQTRL